MNLDPTTWPIIDVPSMPRYESTKPITETVYNVGSFIVDYEVMKLTLPPSLDIQSLTATDDYFWFRCANGDRFPGIFQDVLKTKEAIFATVYDLNHLLK